LGWVNLLPPFFFLRRWDYNGAQRVTKFIANSKEVQKRIKSIYHRDSEVVYTGIDTDFWHPVQSSPPFSAEGGSASGGQGGVPREAGGGGMEKIIWFETAQAAHEGLKNILKPGDVVLFQNDWGDQYL